MRAISLLADITNYIMLELGQPMHSFDGKKVESIVVRDVEVDTPFTTLDGTDRVLPAGTMVIDLNSEIGAVAGIMGGLSSEIESDTTSTFLESANFDCVKVRKSATALGLRSESSARYEKSLDPEMTETALRRYVKILSDIDAGAKVVSSLTDVYVNKYPHIRIEVEKSYIDRYAGVEISKERMLEILKSLGFGVEAKDDTFVIDVPTWRATKDISIKADIVEEITRVYGYDNIEAKPNSQPVTLSRLGLDIVRDYDVKYALADRYNMHEIHSYIWEDAITNKSLGIETESYIHLVNSLQKDNDDIRSSMLPTIIRAVANNKRYASTYGLFEIGHIVTGMEDNLAVEEQSLGLGWATKDYQSGLRNAQNCLQYLFEYVLKLPVKFVVANNTKNYLAPKNYYNLVVDGTVVGELGMVTPVVQHKIAKDTYTILAQVNMTKVNACAPVNYKVEQVSKFPVTTLDFNFVLAQNEVYGKLEQVAHTIKTDLSYKVELLDIFANKEDNTNSYTIRYYVTSMEHTLSSAEIENFHKTVIETFENNNIKLKV